MVDFDNLPDNGEDITIDYVVEKTTNEVLTPEPLPVLEFGITEVEPEEEIIYSKRSGKPISEAERIRRLKLSERAKAGAISRKEEGTHRITRTIKNIISTYADDIANNVKKEKYLEYLAGVKNRTISLDDVEAILHLIVSEQFKKPDKARDNKLIIDATAQIRQITDSKRKIEETRLSLERDQGILSLFEQWARILGMYIPDQKLLNTILFEMRSVLDKTIDVNVVNRNISKSIDDLK